MLKLTVLPMLLNSGFKTLRMASAFFQKLQQYQQKNLEHYIHRDLSCTSLLCTPKVLLENVEHCGGEPEQAANMHMNRLSFTLK